MFRGAYTTGTVTDVEVVSGPEVFHAEALAAGRRLQFEPARQMQTSILPLIHDSEEMEREQRLGK